MAELSTTTDRTDDLPDTPEPSGSAATESRHDELDDAIEEPDARSEDAEDTDGTPDELDTALEQPRPDEAERPEPPNGMHPAVWEKIQAGNDFHAERREYYPYSEVRTEKGYYIDNYIPGEEIVECKHTQLAEVNEKTAMGYLDNTARKYSPGETISATDKNKEQLPPELIGKEIDGQMVLEVPEQDQDVPESIRQRAGELGIIIRDTEGREHL